MSQIPMGVPPLAYQQVAVGAPGPDAGHLTALSICHYVFGGMSILFSSLFIIHIVMGAMIVSGKLPMAPVQPAGMAATQPAAYAAANLNQTMRWMGWLFVIMGGCAVGIGWTIGILSICSGVCIARRRRRIFSLVVAGICCILMPLGTILGIFTIVVLLRESVKQMYQTR